VYIILLILCTKLVFLLGFDSLLANRTEYGRAYATVLRSSVVCRRRRL